MRGTFERDFRYPWAVVLIGEKWAPENLHTGQRLAGRPTYQEAEADLDAHLHNVRRGTVDRTASISSARA